jgi:hypothetical protein
MDGDTSHVGTDTSLEDKISGHRHRKRTSLRSGEWTSGSFNALGAPYPGGRKQRLKKLLSNIVPVMKFGANVDTYQAKTNLSS